MKVIFQSVSYCLIQTAPYVLMTLLGVSVNDLAPEKRTP